MADGVGSKQLNSVVQRRQGMAWAEQYRERGRPASRRTVVSLNGSDQVEAEELDPYEPANFVPIICKTRRNQTGLAHPGLKLLDI